MIKGVAGDSFHVGMLTEMREQKERRSGGSVGSGGLQGGQAFSATSFNTKGRADTVMAR